ncbi:unnamed protein product [Amoebophrya sp. A25]|nr:unnamed protein product [Amoebophrya sp. A25]|eukprot:GSA25T00025941001.1
MKKMTSPLHASAVTDFLQRVHSQLPAAINSIAASTAGNGGACNSDFGAVRGDYNFDFSLRLEGGQGFSNTGILVASANEKKTESGSELPLGIKCRWRRQITTEGGNVDELIVDIAGISTNMYQLSADDIGCRILVEATLADSAQAGHYRGTALGEMGPFELDPSTRKSLENSINAGGSRFPVTFYKKENEPKQNYMLHVTADEIKVIQPGVMERFDREVSIAYSAEFPRVLIHPLDILKFKLLILEENGNVCEMHFASLSRQSRDLIALTMRCFHARRHISTAALLDRVLANPGNHGTARLEHPSNSTKALDLCLYTDRLRGELMRQLETRGAIEKQYHKIAKEKLLLDDQLHDTITSYTGVIQHLQGEAQQPDTSRDPFFQSNHVPLGKYEGLQQEISNLKIELEEQRRQLIQEKHKAKLSNPFGTGGDASEKAEIERLKEENRRLLRTSEQSTEVRRLRVENDRLLEERETLHARLRQADQEKNELSTNFSFVKGEYDKLQMQGTSNYYYGGGSSSSSGAHAVLESSEYRALLEERNRLARRVDQLCEDAEKSKTTQDQSLERVMTSNARLLEEKDRLHREVDRVSRLYAEAVDSFSTSAGDSGRERANAEVVQKDEKIRQLELENQQLKARIRKLASI